MTDLAHQVASMQKRLDKLEAERRQLCQLIAPDEDVDFFEDDGFDAVSWIITKLLEQRPVNLQPELFRLVHVGGNGFRDRIQFGVAEKVFADYWQEYNRRNDVLPAITGRKVLTQNDACIAADVIQWLGTNCGLAFIWECERRIKAIDESYSVCEYKEDSQAAKAIAEGVIQKFAIALCLRSSGRKSIQKCTFEAWQVLAKIAGRRQFDVD